MDLIKIKNEFKNCPCGRAHAADIRAAELGGGVAARTGEILLRNGFPRKLLLVADKNTLKAAGDIRNQLARAGFALDERIYDDLRVADMGEVRRIEGLLQASDGVLAVGTGSVHDICRLAAARKNKPLALFATAASMDGFASYNAPITDGCFKITYPAKTPEVIIADTKILAAAPRELKAAGFGDMMGKYVGLIDWQVSRLVSGEYYCERVAALTRAADDILALRDKIQSDGEDAARAAFEALLLTGIGMSFVKNSRPASGTEHILSHFWECKKLSAGETSDYHGKKVGVATLLVLEEYEKLTRRAAVKAHADTTDYEAVYAAYGTLAGEARKMNAPPPTDAADPRAIEANWQRIREIAAGVPRASEIRAALAAAGCPTDCAGIGVSDDLRDSGMKYHPYMRNRLSLMRLKPMLCGGLGDAD
jgi:glycerol-1-phosphate dehydrogenase [NAD(P)+]